MSLEAHTNAPGVHFQYEGRDRREHGVYRDNVSETYINFDSTEQESVIATAVSRKPLPYQGDHKTPMVYGRSVEKVIDDQPYVLLEESYSHLDRPEGKILQLHKETVGYISTGEGTFQRYPIGKLDESNADREADTKCLLSLGGSKAQLGAELAQARLTIDLLSQSVDRAAQVLLALKRRQFSRLPGLLSIDPRLLASDRGRSQANAWLQYSYGWKPLVDEVYALQEIATQKLSADYLIRGKGAGKIEGSWSYSNNENNWIESATASARSTVVAKIRNESLFNLNSIGMANPAAIAWELSPWSFAVDWFIPVGNVLEAATASYGLDFVKGWRSKQLTYKAECQKQLGPRSAYVDVIVPGSYKEEGFFFFRDPFGDFPSAGVYADVTPFSVPRAVNALALIRQLTL